MTTEAASSVRTKLAKRLARKKLMAGARSCRTGSYDGAKPLARTTEPADERPDHRFRIHHSLRHRSGVRRRRLACARRCSDARSRGPFRRQRPGAHRPRQRRRRRRRRRGGACRARRRRMGTDERRRARSRALGNRQEGARQRGTARHARGARRRQAAQAGTRRRRRPGPLLRVLRRRRKRSSARCRC